ncbi:hypothetical protein [Jiulongibacter sediminis]|jgi:hypothetical protein|uniref:hypothetical protein n=1 Tax=Jiulongibacter sediminis TaxID=1605367 RepID=UPI0026EE5735|nr:hypothetical protein [Jiulongibacter sediminis]
MKKQILLVCTLFAGLYACTPETTEQPLAHDYQTGEKWTWKWNRSVDGEVKAEGEDLQEVLDQNGRPVLWNGLDTLQIPSEYIRDENSTPFRSWPLFVGKTWVYESEWENNEGTKGKTRQDVEVVAFEDIEVAAGTFKAYKIEYKGLVTNSRGFQGEMSDTWWYAPALKTYVLHLNDDGYGLYRNELISYTSGG